MIGHLSCGFAWVAKSGNTSDRAPRGRDGERGGARERESALTHAGEKQGERNKRGMFTRKRVTDSTLLLLLGVF